MTIKRTFWLVAMTLLSLTAHAQHFDWVKSYSGQEPTGKLWNYIVSSVTDSRGNLYVAGQFANGASIAGHELLPITPHGSQCDNLNAAIIKFSPDGQILWSKSLHANDGMPCNIYDMVLVGDTALYVMSHVNIPFKAGEYIYFFDTLVTMDNASIMMHSDSTSANIATAFSILNLDGEFQEHHYLQIAWIDSVGQLVTMDRQDGNPASSKRILNQDFPQGPFCVDHEGNIYIGQVPTDIVALLDGSGYQWFSIENGKLSGVVIMVDGHSRFTFFPENRPALSNYRIFKFSPHFGSMLQQRYVFAETPFWDEDVTTAGRLAIDEEDNIYLCNTVSNNFGSSGSVSLVGGSGMTLSGREADMGFLIKYNRDLIPQYIRQIDYLNTPDESFSTNHSYFHSMTIDDDSNSLFVVASTANLDNTDSMFVDGVQFPANKNAFFLRFDKTSGRFLSYGAVPSNRISTFRGRANLTNVICKNNRVFALPAYQNNIQWLDNEINIEPSKCGKGLYIWDYAGNPLQYIDFNSTSSSSEPGTALTLHDSALYVCGYSTSNMTITDTTVYVSGSSLAYIARYVDTTFMTSYIHTEDPGEVSITLVEDGLALVAYPNPFRQRVNVEYSGQQPITSAYLTDIMGRTEQVELSATAPGRYTLDLTARPQAAYLLTLVTQDGHRHTVRLLKQSEVFGN
ncbi:MAG: T9SS type A sorting domain-containing protein [Bacteroidales bacterium]|nr:T9SS type A sorting domain-containing protein [Candidatus Colimorpha pelethequi]